MVASGSSFRRCSSYTQTGTSNKFTIKGSVATTANSVNGTLTFTIDFTQGGTTMKGDVVADYQMITFDSSGCGTGGSLVVTSAYNVSAAGQSASMDSKVTIDFGPACGTYAVYVN